jgi:mannitol-1-phosphate/altronate dehydrogenase
MLVTTSLGGLRPAIVSIIRDGLVARAQRKAPPLFVLACENEVKSADLQREIEREVAAGVIAAEARFVPCVVDRICPAIMDDRSHVVVRAEEYGRISLWHDSDLSFFWDRLSAQARAARAIMVESSRAHLEFTERKKKWLINGPHLLLAINAHHANYLTFESYIRDYPAVALGMLQEFGEGCFHVCTEGNNLPIAPKDIRIAIEQTEAEVLARFANFSDLTNRIMHRFVQPTEKNPASMQDFFRNMQYKIVEPAQAYYESTGEMPHRMCDTLLKLVELIAKDRFIPKE